MRKVRENIEMGDKNSRINGVSPQLVLALEAFASERVSAK